MLIENLLFGVIGLIILTPIFWLFLRFLYGPILAYEKIKKIFKIKDNSVIDNILTFLTMLLIIFVLYIIFDSGLIF